MNIIRDIIIIIIIIHATPIGCCHPVLLYGCRRKTMRGVPRWEKNLPALASASRSTYISLVPVSYDTSFNP